MVYIESGLHRKPVHIESFVYIINLNQPKVYTLQWMVKVQLGLTIRVRTNANTPLTARNGG